MSDPDRRFTTDKTLRLCMKLARVEAFDLDVAADPLRACAPRFFTAAENGLEQTWGGRVWCNPPFSCIRPWIEKAWSEWQKRTSINPTTWCERIAMLLPANRTEQPWWQELIEQRRDLELVERRWSIRTHFLPGRVRFGSPEDPRGERAGSPRFGCVLLVWGGSPIDC